MQKADLNSGQLEAVSHDIGPMLALAGPGSGKTTVVIHRVKNIIDALGIPPYKILVITYTKAAASEMEERFLKLMGQERTAVSFGTFHALFFRILREHSGYTLDSVLKEEEKWNILRKIVSSLQLEIQDEEEFTENFISQLSRMKNELIPPEVFEPEDMAQAVFLKIFHQYEQEKAREFKIDFDDMQSECHKALQTDEQLRRRWQEKYSFILVDEFQDINAVQYECVKILAAPQNNLFVVGDDDQSIYQFRGAKPEFLLNFSKDYPETKIAALTCNYRSTDPIIRLADGLIRHNQRRYSKRFMGTGRKGEMPSFFSAEDVSQESVTIVKKIQKLHEEGMPYEEIAVLFRVNLQAGVFTRYLNPYGIPFRLKDQVKNIYDHWIWKDLSAYIRLALDQNDDQSFLRIANKPKRYISKAVLEILRREENCLKNIYVIDGFSAWQHKHIDTLKLHLAQIRRRAPYEAIQYIRNVVGYDDYLEEYAQYRRGNLLGMKEIAEELMQAAKGVTTLADMELYYEALRDELKQSKNKPKQEEEGVLLSTLHSAKGLEFEAVFIPGMVEGSIPYEKSQTPERLEEERRLFYVGVTRAKSYLCLSEPQKKFEQETERSRFLKEIGLPDRKKKKESLRKN